MLGFTAISEVSTSEGGFTAFVRDLWHTSVQALKQYRNVELAE